MIKRLKLDLEKLVNEMLDRLPEDIFKSNSTTFLDPEIGGGQFVAAIEERLRKYGHSDVNISKRVFGLTKNRIRLNYIMNTYKIVGNYSIGDFLTKEYNDMKFDIVIGNPPYQQQSKGNGSQPKAHNLWTKFCTYAFNLLKEDGILTFVTPASWGSPTSPIFKLFKSQECNLIYVNLDVNKFFPGIGSTFSYWAVSKSKQREEVDLSGFNIPKDELLYVPNNPTKSMINIHNKVCWKNNKKLDWRWDTTTNHSTPGKKELWKAEKTGEFKYKVFHTNAQSFFSQKQNQEHKLNKIILTLSGYYKPTLQEEPISTSEIVLFILNDTPEHLVNSISYINSKLYRFIATTGKWSGYLNKAVLLRLPELDNTKTWNNKEVYEHFKLTQEEIDLVESTID